MPNELHARLRKAASVIHIAVDEPVADDLKALLLEAESQLVAEQVESAALREQVTRLKQALRDIADPISALRADAEQRGMRLDGFYANELANNAHWLRQQARSALNPPPTGAPGMTSEKRREMAERIVRGWFGKGTRPREFVGWECDLLVDRVESSLSDAYQLGQVEALTQAAEGVMDAPISAAIGGHEKVNIANWLRTRAAKLEASR